MCVVGSTVFLYDGLQIAVMITSLKKDPNMLPWCHDLQCCVGWWAVMESYLFCWWVGWWAVKKSYLFWWWVGWWAVKASESHRSALSDPGTVFVPVHFAVTSSPWAARAVWLGWFALILNPTGRERQGLLYNINFYFKLHGLGVKCTLLIEWMKSEFLPRFTVLDLSKCVRQTSMLTKVGRTRSLK